VPYIFQFATNRGGNDRDIKNLNFLIQESGKRATTLASGQAKKLKQPNIFQKRQPITGGI
jgi:hypothetical protein